MLKVSKMKIIIKVVKLQSKLYVKSSQNNCYLKSCSSFEVLRSVLILGFEYLI